MAGAVSGRRIITTAAPTNFVANLLTGQVFENIPYDAELEIALVSATAAAAPATGLIAQVSCDSDIVLQDVNEPNLLIKATAPVYPDDFLITLVCVAGSRLFLQVRNNSVGDIVCFYQVRIRPLL
jgi:hypothetical protein